MTALTTTSALPNTAEYTQRQILLARRWALLLVGKYNINKNK